MEIRLEWVAASATAGVSAAELEAYRAGMSRLGLISVHETGRAAENVTFYIKHSGSSISKCYVYRRTPPAAVRVVERIREEDVKTFGEVYRDLGGGWYLTAYETSS